MIHLNSPRPVLLQLVQQPGVLNSVTVCVCGGGLKLSKACCICEAFRCKSSNNGVGYLSAGDFHRSKDGGRQEEEAGEGRRERKGNGEVKRREGGRRVLAYFSRSVFSGSGFPKKKSCSSINKAGNSPASCCFRKRVVGPAAATKVQL